MTESEWFGESGNCPLDSLSMRGCFYRGLGKDIDAPNETKIKPRKCEDADDESDYNENHLYVCQYTGMLSEVNLSIVSMLFSVSSI
jgi:hypothetical protein